jgi:hypothetical protein
MTGPAIMGRGKTSGWNSYEPHTVDCTGCFTTWCTTYVAVQRELGLLSERRAGNCSDHSVDNGIARKSLSTAMAVDSIKLLFFQWRVLAAAAGRVCEPK